MIWAELSSFSKCIFSEQSTEWRREQRLGHNFTISSDWTDISVEMLILVISAPANTQIGQITVRLIVWPRPVNTAGKL